MLDQFVGIERCAALPRRQSDGAILRATVARYKVIEQDHRFIKKKVRASQCFKRFYTAERTLEGIEAVNMMSKGQVKR